MRRKNRLKVLLVILVSIFIMFSAAALLLAGFQKSEREAQKKKEAMAALESLPTAAPTEVPVTPSPSPTPRPTATPTPVSYTHLDVYKRQEWNCTALPK